MRPGDTVFVELYEQGDRWVAGGVSRAPQPADVTFIRGRVASVEGGQAQIEYGIETYFVEEGRGPELQDAIPENRLYVDVALDERGRAKIAGVVLG